MIDKRDFYYHLPEHLIAKKPFLERDSSRMLVLDKGGMIADKTFRDLSDYLRAGDLLVLNNTKVIPARLFLHKETGGRVICLLERRLDDDKIWAQLHANKALKLEQFLFLDGQEIFQIKAYTNELYLLQCLGEMPLWRLFESYGHVPLPPYMRRDDGEEDVERYQTVYAETPGAVAAPTAGLHFTQNLLEHLTTQGIKHVSLTLHIGMGTFRPIRVADVREHTMHPEYMILKDSVVDQINNVKSQGGRIIAVGTTVLRALESAALPSLHPYEGDTDLFIYPGFEFKVVDLLITNFHLPESTLLMLVCAFSGQAQVLSAYQHAIAQSYRFYSYGDSMLLTRA